MKTNVMKKISVTLLACATLVIAGQSFTTNQAIVHADSSTKTVKVNKKSKDYKAGYKYGQTVAKFDKTVLKQSDAKFHDGSAWNKNYSAGYYAGYGN